MFWRDLSPAEVVNVSFWAVKLNYSDFLFTCKPYPLLKESIVYICAIPVKARSSWYPWELFALHSTWSVLEERLHVVPLVLECLVSVWMFTNLPPVLESYYWAYSYFKLIPIWILIELSWYWVQWCLLWMSVTLQLLKTNFHSKFLLVCRFSGLPIMKPYWPPVALTAG